MGIFLYPMRRLSHAEREVGVLQAMFNGQPHAQTAERLQTTVGQVKRIEGALIRKLGLNQTREPRQTYPLTEDDR